MTVIRPRLLIAVQTYPDGGGISAIVENLVHRFDGPFDVHLAVVELREGTPHQLDLAPERLHACGFSNVINPLLMPFSLAYAVLVGRFLRKVVDAVRPAALLTQDALNLPVPAAFAVRNRPTKLVVMDHGTLSNVRDRSWQRMVIRRLPVRKRIPFAVTFALDLPWRAIRWRAGMRLADAAWFVGEELKPTFRLAGPRAAQYQQIIPSDFFPPDELARAAARRELGVEGVETVVNAVTRFDGEKGLGIMVEALRRLAPDPRKVVVLLAGHGTLEDWLRGKLAEFTRSGTVRWLGQLDRDRIRSVHHASDFHLYTGTIGCAVSIALLEAMSCGVIPLVSDVPAAHMELVGPSGRVFRAGDTDALEAALRWAVSTYEGERRHRRGAVLEQLRSYSEPSLDSLLQQLFKSRPSLS